MIDLVFGLHLYQPPNQRPDILKSITRESYLSVIELILSHPRALFTVDLARSAIENLENQETGREFLAKVRKALELKKISLVNTAAYHPILPLIPNEEIVRQIRLNEQTYKNLFEEFYQKPEGFFPPEMAFSQKLIGVLEGLGYQWLITDDIPFSCFYKLDPPFNWIAEQNNIAVFLRSSFWSNRISFYSLAGNIFAQTLKRDLRKWFSKSNETEGFLIIWMDWETFGHHRPEHIKNFLVPFLDNLGPEINLTSPEYLLSKYQKKEMVVPSGSWSTSADDFRHKNYWPLWHNPRVEFHKLWWQLAKIILDIKKNIDDEKTLEIFDKALYSCQTWQYSMGNKHLAVRGIGYFRDISELKAAEPQKEKIIQIIKKLEELC